jgi:hypothetical protein
MGRLVYGRSHLCGDFFLYSCDLVQMVLDCHLEGLKPVLEDYAALFKIV